MSLGFHFGRDKFFSEGKKKSDVFCISSACLGRFVIGREKEGVESEVARLINESLELDKTCRKVQHLKRR